MTPSKGTTPCGPSLPQYLVIPSVALMTTASYRQPRAASTLKDNTFSAFNGNPEMRHRSKLE
jgi:hypothetical protein